MKINNLGLNKTEVEKNNLCILFSYKQAVAIFDRYSGRCFHTTEKYSKTTSKHINSWITSKSTPVTQELLDRMIEVGVESALKSQQELFTKEMQ